MEQKHFETCHLYIFHVSTCEKLVLYKKHLIFKSCCVRVLAVLQEENMMEKKSSGWKLFGYISEHGIFNPLVPRHTVRILKMSDRNFLAEFCPINDSKK